MPTLAALPLQYLDMSGLKYGKEEETIPKFVSDSKTIRVYVTNPKPTFSNLPCFQSRACWSKRNPPQSAHRVDLPIKTQFFSLSILIFGLDFDYQTVVYPLIVFVKYYKLYQKTNLFQTSTLMYPKIKSVPPHNPLRSSFFS